MNVPKDIAVCGNCDGTFPLSSLVTIDPVPPEFALNQPPRGAWYREEFGGWTLGATTRSPLAFFIIPFLCVWSGFSLGGIYGTQIVAGQFNLLISLFGIPFLLGTVALAIVALMSVAGRYEITMNRGSGVLFCGIGPIGWTRRFDWTKVATIDEFLDHSRKGNGHQTSILLEGETRIKFGALLSEPRRYFLLQGLRTLHQG